MVVGGTGVYMGYSLNSSNIVEKESKFTKRGKRQFFLVLYVCFEQYWVAGEMSREYFVTLESSKVKFKNSKKKQLPHFFFLICLGVSNAGLHRAQNHLPFGFELSPTQPKWNHSIGH